METLVRICERFAPVAETRFWVCPVKTRLRRLHLPWVFLIAFSCGAFTASAALAPELHARSGLPHLVAPKNALRVAYLGGSITAAANGWRSLATEQLRTRFTNTIITEISAGLPGTGSDLGACRLERDVLRQRPDLLFVEFAVNDSNTAPARVERTIEGIVRQTWRADPRTDVVFVYTVSTPGLPDLQAGKFPPAAEAMERVAAHYGIPSLHFGVEVTRRIAAGSLVFKNADAPEDVRTFSTDGVHPTASGHRVYVSTLVRALQDLINASVPRSAKLPPPLHADNWENAKLRELDSTLLEGNWALVEPGDPNLPGATKSLLPPTWRATNPGDHLTFQFTGRTFGLLGIAAPDSGEFRVTVDDREPVTATFFDAFVSETFCRQRPWFYPGELEERPHRVRVELLGTTIDKSAIKATRSGEPLGNAQAYQAHHLTLCGALIVGSESP
jgi:lysophospholipase L1-like esterase